MCAWCFSRCCSGGSSQQSAAGHPAPRPVWTRVSWNLLQEEFNKKNPPTSTLKEMRTHPPPPPSSSLSSLCGRWSGAESNLLEHGYLGDNFNVRADVTSTRRLMLAWPLVHATLGMPTGFPLALWGSQWSRENSRKRRRNDEMPFDPDVN